MPTSDPTWPAPWTLKPTEGEPHDSSHIDGDSIGWDLSFGFRLNIDHDDCQDESTPLTINAHFSDADLARGFVKRKVTPAQLQEFARLLLNIAAKQQRRQTPCDTFGCSLPVHDGPHVPGVPSLTAAQFHAERDRLDTRPKTSEANR